MKILKLVSLMIVISHSGNALAQESVTQENVIVARVTELQGNAFVFKPSGESKRLAYGDRIFAKSEIMVEDGASVSLLDLIDNKHHLASGAYAKFYPLAVELKHGQMWTQGMGKRKAMVNTANAIVAYEGASFISVVDNKEVKTQVLSLSGTVEFINSFDPSLRIDVQAGMFSFIDHNDKSILPRTPTRIGLKSYQDLRGRFANVSSLKGEDYGSTFGGSREIASVQTAAPSSKKGKIIFIRTLEKKSNAARGIASLPRQKTGLHSAPVNYYGVKKQEQRQSEDKVQVSIQPNRNIASIPTAWKQQPKPESEFEKSLGRKLEANQRHPDEVNQLIDELKSFRKNYSKSY